MQFDKDDDYGHLDPRQVRFVVFYVICVSCLSMDGLGSYRIWCTAQVNDKLSHRYFKLNQIL